MELSDADGAEGAAGKTGGMFAPAAFASADGSENPNAEVCVGSAGTTEGAPTAGASGAGKPGAAVAESVSWSRSLLFCGLEGNFFFSSVVTVVTVGQAGERQNVFRYSGQT